MDLTSRMLQKQKVFDGEVDRFEDAKNNLNRLRLLLTKNVEIREILELACELGLL